jgi:hypothetical protein
MCRGATERAARALELLVQASAGSSGYLYLVRGGELQLAAPAYGDEPGSHLREKATRAVASISGEQTLVDDDADREPASSITPSSIPTSERCIVLCSHRGQAPVVIGAAVILAGSMPLATPDPRTVEEIAQKLADAGDVKVDRSTSG